MTPSGHDRERETDRAGRQVTERLGLIVEQEARRVLSARHLAPDPERLADGWERRFTTDAARAAEAMELYRELGYEVCADSVDPEELGEDCDDCQLAALVQFKTIYTRKRKEVK